MPRVVGGRFQQKGQSRQGRMGNDPKDGLLSDGPLSDQGVAVLMGAQRVQAVVDVHRLEAAQADDPVEFLQYAVQVAGDVVAPVGNVAGVQTDPQPVPAGGQVQNPPQLLKPAPISLPLPAMVSRRTVVRRSGVTTRSSMAAIWRQPVSTPWPTWLPGWKL